MVIFFHQMMIFCVKFPGGYLWNQLLHLCPGMILQVAGSLDPPLPRNVPMIRHLAQQRADVNYRITVAWCVFFWKGKCRGSEWNGMILFFFLLPHFFLFQIMKKNIYLIFLKGYSQIFLRFFLEDGTSEGFYTFGTHSCKAADFALASIDTTGGYGAEVLACYLK